MSWISCYYTKRDIYALERRSFKFGDNDSQKLSGIVRHQGAQMFLLNSNQTLVGCLMSSMVQGFYVC